MIKEIWKDIKDFEGLYQISNLGRIKSLGNKTHNKEHIKEPFKQISSNKGGYTSLGIHLYKNGKRYNKKIHRLVAEAFVYNTNPEEYTIVNHKDENPLNNIYTNLEWCNTVYNMNYGTVANRMKEMSIKTKVSQFDREGNLIANYPSIMEASRQTGIQPSLILNCINGGHFSKERNKWVNCFQAKGFIFKEAS